MLEFLVMEWTGESDGDLVRAVSGKAAGRATEEEAELCRRLAPRVRMYGLRHLRDEAAAADLVQQVLMITLEGLREGRVREPDKLASFVLGTCRMVVLEIRRGGQRRQRLLDEYVRTQATTVAPVEPIDMQQLMACLMTLAERERSVILMTFYKDQSSEAVGASLGMSLSNVRVVRHRALGRLRTCMGGDA